VDVNHTLLVEAARLSDGDDLEPRLLALLRQPPAGLSARELSIALGMTSPLTRDQNEKQRRWLAALLAEQFGLSRGGVRQISRICGISEKTVRRGLKEAEL